MTKATLGLHTKEERDFAAKMAKEAYEEGMKASKERNLVGMAFQVGVLHAIYMLAFQEGADQLADEIGRLRSKLDHAIKTFGR